MGFEAITYVRPTISKNYINDVDKAFQSLPPRNTYGSADPAIKNESGAIITPCANHEQCPMFISGSTDGPQCKYDCCFSQCDENPSYLQRLIAELSKNNEDCEYSYVAFRRGINHRIDTKNKISPTKDDFGTTLIDGEHGTPVQHSVTTPQLHSNPPMHHPLPIKCRRHVILDV